MFLAFAKSQNSFGRGFARYLNKGQRAAIDMKSDMTAYEQIPDMISNLDPGPGYPERPLNNNQNVIKNIRDAKHNLERLRTSGVAKRQNEQRFARGRLFSHYKLEEIRADVKHIKSKERETATKKELALKRQRGVVVPDYEIDDQFQLPYGLGFDHIIKKKAELIDGQKQSNNLVMDQLINELGYMDYRDALACNKYIIEAKRSGDYHQMARGRVLESALSSLDKRKRAEIERNATKEAAAFTPGSEEWKQAGDNYKLNTLMREDPSISTLY